MESRNDGVMGGEELIEQAEAFLRLCYRELGKSEAELIDRSEAVREEIRRCGTYSHTAEELAHGAKMAWRHNSRCIGRLFWHTLEVIDARGAETAEQVAEALFSHLKRAANGGRIRPVMTVFQGGDDPAKAIRIWNHQLIRYAGYPGDGEQPRCGCFHCSLPEARLAGQGRRLRCAAAGDQHRGRAAPLVRDSGGTGAGSSAQPSGN